MSATFDVQNPATGQCVQSVPNAGLAEARAAARSAIEAFPAWRDRSAYERSAILRRWFNLILHDEERLARLMTEEMGKPITESRGEVKYAAAFVEWYAEEAKRVYGETVPSQFTHKRLFVRPQAVGPVYAVTPWNFPAAMVTRKAAPALAAGCTVVLKPAEQSPLTALRLEELWREAGGPADVFQVLTTVDPALVSSVFFDEPAIRKLTFTGSTEVGVLLAAQAAKTVKRVSLELGGHAPFLVFDDADLDLAVREVVASKFRNTGQTCVCANRIYVQADIHDEFARRLGDVVKGLRMGDPLDAAVSVGPLVDQQGHDKVLGPRHRRAGQGRPRARRRQAARRPLLRTHRAHGRRARHAHPRGRDIRPGRAARAIRARRRRGGGRQRHAVRAGRVSVDARFVAGVPRVRGTRLRDRRRERRRAVDAAGAVWRCQGVRPRARRRQVGHRGVSGPQVRVDCPHLGHVRDQIRRRTEGRCTRA